MVVSLILSSQDSNNARLLLHRNSWALLLLRSNSWVAPPTVASQQLGVSLLLRSNSWSCCPTPAAALLLLQGSSSHPATGARQQYPLGWDTRTSPPVTYGHLRIWTSAYKIGIYSNFMKPMFPRENTQKHDLFNWEFQSLTPLFNTFFSWVAILRCQPVKWRLFSRCFSVINTDLIERFLENRAYFGLTFFKVEICSTRSVTSLKNAVLARSATLKAVLVAQY